jgi:phage shock protein PspC (stress-responsive transcriptional regulator)
MAASLDDPTTPVRRELRRSRERKIAGVCGGIADWLEWSHGTVRFLFCLVAFMSVGFPGIVAYLLFWYLIPGPDA